MSNKHFKFDAKSVAAIAVAAALILGLGGYLVSRNSVQEVTAQEPMIDNMASGTQEASAAEEPVVRPTVSTLPQIKATEPSQPVLPKVEPETTPQAAPTESPAKKTFVTASPVSGDSIGDYAMDCLSYNETTRDWRIHNGIDLAAEEGSPVCAAADGTVYTTYEDDSLGYTVVIRHEGGYTTRYSSLREDLAVKPGDTVTLGQTIGYAGDSALIESVMGPHVHFSVSCQDIPMDPEEFLALG